MHAWRKRGQVWALLIASGGGLFVLESCDPTVRDTVLNGVGGAASSLATTFIQAFMESLTNGEPNDTATTVQARAFGPTIFA